MCGEEEKAAIQVSAEGRLASNYLLSAEGRLLDPKWAVEEVDGAP